jgi:hypothetical protein
MLKTIDWTTPLTRAVLQLERKFQVDLCLDSDIVAEIGSHLKRTVDAIPMDTDPNVAKIAGHVAFWIRKLKPITPDQNVKQQHKLLAANELAALLVGAAICRTNFKADFRLPNRIFHDWASSLRINSHSPNSCAIAFELLTTDRQA